MRQSIRRLRWCAALVPLVAAAVPAPGATAATKPATIVVATGTAFRVGTGGEWITAAHVVARCRGPLRFAAQGRPLIDDPAGPATVLRRDARRDVAVLRFAERGPPLVLRERGARDDEAAAAVGFPGSDLTVLTLQSLWHEDIAAGRGEARQQIDFWLIRNGVPPGVPRLSGLSGGPLIDVDGVVIGLASAQFGRIRAVDGVAIEDLLGAVARVTPGVPGLVTRPAGPSRAADALSLADAEAAARRAVAAGQVREIACEIARPRRAP